MANKKPNLVKRCCGCMPHPGKRLFGKRVRSWKCWCVRCTIGLPLLFIALLVIVTQTGVLGWIMLPRMSEAIGMEISSSRVYVARSGRLIMLDVTVRVPEIEGEAGEFVRVKRLDAAVQWWPTLKGDPTLTQVVATSPRVRLSESIEDGSINVGMIPTPKVDARMDGTTLSLFEIIVENMTLEIGEHGPAGYKPLKNIVLDGTLLPTGDENDSRYDIALAGKAMAPGGLPLVLTGYVDPDGIMAELRGFALHDWSAESIPTPDRELMAALDLRGSLERTVFSYDMQKGLTAKFVLVDGEMNLPINPEGDGPVTDERLRATSVKGVVTFTPDGLFADATALVGDLPTKIKLDVDGLDLNSAFTLKLESKGFSLEKNPDLLPFAPSSVRKRLRNFSSPTAMVDTSVTIYRAPPTEDGPGEITFSGEMLLTNGVAAYAKIPYLFEDIIVHATFNQDRVDIDRMEGKSASGAKLSGTGWISPPSGNAEVQLTLKVTDLPTDAMFREALGEKYGPTYEEVFDSAAYQSLLDRGLIITRAQQIDYEKRLADPTLAPEDQAALRKLLAIPMFELGGMSEATIRLHRPPLDHTEWDVDFDFSLVEGGVLVHAFPMPFVARNATIWSDLDNAKLLNGTFTGINGGEATVSLDIDLVDGFHPDIVVTGTDVPVDELLISAIPESGRGLSGQSVMRDLGMRGRADTITVHVIDRENGDAGFDAKATFSEATLTPRQRDRDHRLWSRNVAGEVRVSERDLFVKIAGDFERNAQNTDAHGPQPGVPGGHMEATATVLFGKGDNQTTFSSDITLTEADVEMHFEDLIGVFSEPAAAQSETLRQAHNPVGRLDARVTVGCGPTGTVETEVLAYHMRDVQLDLLAGRVQTGELAGELTAKIGSDNVIEFRGLRSEMSFDGMASGVVELNGDAPMSLFAGEAFGKARERPYEIIIEDGRFESPLTNRIVERFMSPRTAAWYMKAQPSGVYNAHTWITSESTSGNLEPRTFAYNNHGTRAQYERMEGLIDFFPDGGTLTGVKGSGDGWTISTEGSWVLPGEGMISVDVSYAIEAEELTQSLHDALPLDLRAGLETLELQLAGPLQVDDGHASYTIRADYDDPFVETTLSGSFTQAQFLTGVQVDNCEGTFAASVSIDPAESYSAFSIDLSADRMLASGIKLRNTQASIMRDTAGVLELTDFVGDCHGGTVTANARTWPGAENTSEYLANVQLAGVRLSPVLIDLEQAKSAAAAASDSGASPGVMQPETLVEQDGEPDDSRGMLEGSMSIGGVVGDPASRRGTGRFRVAGGEVMQSPTLVVLVELASLQFPEGATLDYATIDFFIDGVTVAIEDLSIYSSRIKIRGFGTLDWLSQELDMRFFAGSANMIPLIGPLISAWQHLVSVEVKGKIGEHQIEAKIFESSSNPFREAVHLGGREMHTVDDKKTVTNVIEEGGD